ncbi:hypothetical protein [Piscinibacter sp.]|uniref:hypothetical protein n=1 Tax=Piscinibacter sp. TaxID=1903157 RepID=UPI002B7584C8|nr:hypothetical protein [Albitalea sp.]HUG26217.1 hypothetical protein [Albitalea sp.]
MDPRRDAFGRLLSSPSELDFVGRVDCLRRLAGELQAGLTVEARWLGRSLATWLADGGDLDAVLGVRAPQGSKRTAQALVLAERRAGALLQLATALGSDALALRVLQGSEACPAQHADLLATAQSLRCPASREAFRRARASRHRT